MVQFVYILYQGVDGEVGIQIKKFKTLCQSLGWEKNTNLKVELVDIELQLERLYGSLVEGDISEQSKRENECLERRHWDIFQIEEELC